MKFLKVAAVMAIALCLATSVYAETQSVKVSGDLTVRGLMRSNYDLRDSAPMDPAGGAVRTNTTGDVGGMLGIAGAYPGDDQGWWMSAAEVQVDAELTDNVSTVIRIFNERDWNVQAADDGTGVASFNNASSLAPNGLGLYAPQGNEFQISLDLAYVTLKNFIYCPLTVTIGRQDLWFGKGFVVGTNQRFNNRVAWQNGTLLNAPEYTSMNAFDSIKAVLDYDPWTITAAYANLWTNTIGDTDGQNLYGINVGYKFDCYKAEAEAYWFFKQDNTIPSWGQDCNSSNDVHTVGIRGSMDPLECVTLAGEIAGQFGNYTANQVQFTTRQRAAWALDVSAEYRGLMDLCWKPKLGVEYILYSGNKDDDAINNNISAAYTGWDPMFRGKFDSAIREFVGTYYASYDYPARPQYYYSTADASYTNQQQVIFSGTLTPMDCLTLKGNYNLFWTIEQYQVNNTVRNRDGNNSGFIGQEVDLQAIWDYTEDVSFGVLGAWFVPNGDIYGAQGNNAVASDVVGTVKVSF